MSGISPVNNTVTNTTNLYEPKKSHAGLYTGITLSALPIATYTLLHKAGKELNLNIKPSNKTKIGLAFMTALNISYGLILDKLIKDKQINFSKKTEGMTTQDAVESDERGRSTKKGNPYYYSNTGKKFGTLSGFITLPVLALSIANKNLRGLKLALGSSVVGLWGGLMIGSIIDGAANKVAIKNADNKNKITAK